MAVYKARLSPKQTVTLLSSGQKLRAMQGVIIIANKEDIKQLDENPYWEKGKEKDLKKIGLKDVPVQEDEEKKDD